MMRGTMLGLLAGLGLAMMLTAGMFAAFTGHEWLVLGVPLGLGLAAWSFNEAHKDIIG